MKKALVTGGAGFIGSHLCDRLLKDGWKVWSIDNFITGSPKNIEHLKDNQNFIFIEADVAKPLPEELLREKFDAILHFASPASPRGYYEYPIETSLANSVGTYNMLELARKNKAEFVLASTSEVYGEPEVHPQPESYWGNVNPVGLRSCYDESKRFADSLTMTYFRQFGTDVRIVRIFNTYGPRMQVDDGRVIPNFTTRALAGEDMVIYGDGKGTRAFCYIDDLVEGIVRILNAKGIESRILNLGNPHEITILELAEMIKKLTGSQSGFIYEPAREDDPTRRRPDITKVKTLLGWDPKVPLEEGLVKTIEYFKGLDESSNTNSHV